MSKRQFNILLGVWLMALLFLGFPAWLDKAFALLSGLIIIILAYSEKPQRRAVQTGVPYVEHRAEPQRAEPQRDSRAEVEILEQVSVKITSDNIEPKTDAS